MRKIIFFLFLLIPALNIYAQDNEIENLKQQISRHPQPDTFRVNRLVQLANLSKGTPDEVEKLGTEALTISKQIGYTTGIGYALSAIGVAEFRLNKAGLGEDKLRQADSIAKLLKDPILQVDVLMNQAVFHSTKDNNKSLALLLEAEQLAEKNNNKRRLSDVQSQTASLYHASLTNYPKAMEYTLKSIRSAEEINYLRGMVSGWRQLGNIYTYLGDQQSSILYFQKAVDANEKLGDKDLEALLYSDLGESYRLTGRYAEAIKYDKEADKRSKRIDRVEVVESNIADVYVRTDQLDSAFHYAFSSLDKAKDLEDGEGIAWIDGILARAYLKKKMPDSAIFYALNGIDYAAKTNSLEFRRDNAEALANAYVYKNDFTNAYKYHLVYIQYRDSSLNAAVANNATVLQHDYDQEKQQSQINALNQQRKLQRYFLIGALIVMGLIIITAILLLRANRKQQKVNSLLQTQKQEIDEKAKELSIQKDNVELLGEIGRKINSSLSIENIISTVYSNANALMDAAIFGIGIYHEHLKRIEFPATYENGKALSFYVNEISDDSRLAVNCFTTGREIIMGNLQQEYKNYVQHVPSPHEGGQPLSVIFLPLVAKEKKLGVITVQSFNENAYTDYHLYMLRNIAVYTAIALENAESYQALNHTLDTLKTTQAQLVQSEKMASLGELTAGIAHEIQNPLNFVNNFSEVNRELAGELKDELAIGNQQSAIEIANDIISNSEKINHHGKRADAIVKGMLQHSRSGASAKELTNINALADEYLRLSYHGLRAKDKEFNATMKTEFDENIGNINIIPQDIGRVLLNLYNNAFYAVQQKQKAQQLTTFEKLSTVYDPTIIVSTKKERDNVLITVRDNGNGIPAASIDKIFQPFFTTKPTGEGTGLGLSLAYDIVIKQHGGTLKAESQEGQGSAFIITIPLGVER